MMPIRLKVTFDMGIDNPRQWGLLFPTPLEPAPFYPPFQDACKHIHPLLTQTPTQPPISSPDLGLALSATIVPRDGGPLGQRTGNAPRADAPDKCPLVCSYCPLVSASIHPCLTPWFKVHALPPLF
jgi:hypothetical protein